MREASTEALAQAEQVDRTLPMAAPPCGHQAASRGKANRDIKGRTGLWKASEESGEKKEALNPFLGWLIYFDSFLYFQIKTICGRLDYPNGHC